MIRRGIPAVLAALAITVGASAQGPARFRWQTGQVLTYRVEQTLMVTSVSGGKQVAIKNHHTALKCWQVLGVDAAGVATLQISNRSLVYEGTGPNGTVLRYDSAHPDQGTPQLRETFGQYVGRPLGVIRVDGLGRVVEVKEVKFGSVSQFEADPPFVGVLPADGLKAGGAWERAYQVTVEPPQGTGEKFPAVQRYVCKDVTNNVATVALTTEVRNQPAAAGDRVPLLQVQPEGVLTFDVQAGRLQGASLRIDKELKDFDGPGSSYHFQSAYSVQYAGDR